MDSEIPRRNDLRRNSAAELAIRAAIDAVEAMPADLRLTDAVVLLGEAKESVADFIDAVQRRRFVRVEDANVDQAPALASEPHQAPAGWQDIRAQLLRQVAYWRGAARMAHENSKKAGVVPDLDRRQCFGVAQAYAQCATDLEAKVEGLPPAPSLPEGQ